MKKLLQAIMLLIIGLTVTNCAFTDSALKYSYEGTKRVHDGYEAKAKMTKYLTEYLKEANKNCGVRIEMVNGLPLTTIKECVRAQDVLATVDRVQIIKPQHVADMAESAGNLMVKSTNLVVPFASIYYGFRNNEVNQAANVAMNSSNNAKDSNMWGAYTGSYQNNTVTTTNTTDIKDISVTNTKEITDVPNIKVDVNSTTIN